MDRREFIHLMGIASLTCVFPRQGWATKRLPDDLYEIPNFGNARLLHITDCHAQLEPIHFR
jgi:S-sulfosulfanyl-L-cysteine sulfohydrolase